MEDVQQEAAREAPADATTDVNCGKDVHGVPDKAITVIPSKGTVKAMEAAVVEWDDGPSCDLFPPGVKTISGLTNKCHLNL